LDERLNGTDWLLEKVGRFLVGKKQRIQFQAEFSDRAAFPVEKFLPLGAV
jgi:hypothetical protein